MSNLINYAATGANTLKNWDLMTRAAPTKLSVEKDFRFWPFYEMFVNHIENMGWITSLIFAKSGTDYNIAKDFGQVKIVEDGKWDAKSEKDIKILALTIQIKELKILFF